MTEDWLAWHEEYDDPASPLSQRRDAVRARLARVLDAGDRPVRLLSLCAGEGLDTIPVVAASARDVEVCLVELDGVLADRARRTAQEAGVRVNVREGDAGDPATYADRLPVDVLLLVGVLGNVTDGDVVRTVRAAASMVTPGGMVIWTRSSLVRSPATHEVADPAAWVLSVFEDAGFVTDDYVVPTEGAWRLGVSRLDRSSGEPIPPHLFTFIR
jgi:2-polyprenyl-3-methyl-5-hydroxy-6-metoxy-1,4-benzoquinol methylase